MVVALPFRVEPPFAVLGLVSVGFLDIASMSIVKSDSEAANSSSEGGAVATVCCHPTKG
jgi:hypothetical protein